MLYGVEPNDLLHCVIDGMNVNGRLDTVLEIAGTGQGPCANETFSDETSSGDLKVNISGQRRRANRWRTPVDAVT